MFGYTLIKPCELKQLKERINELKLAGWAAVCGWYETTGYIKADDYEKVKMRYNWHREYAVFARGKEIDGPEPDFCKYLKLENKE